jgi:hypothetical protein
MPSTADPSTITTGPGKLHNDVVNAAADLYAQTSSAVLGVLVGVLNQPLAAPSVTASFASGSSADATLLLVNTTYGPFYVGDSGGDQLQDLFRVVNAADDTEIFDPVSRTYVAVTAISPAAIGAGFFAANLTLTFTPSIPQNVTYKVYYGKQALVGSLPIELASHPTIRRSPDRVRFPEYLRSGIAPTVIVNTATDLGLYLDPYKSHWRAHLRGATVHPTTGASSGSTGYVYVGRKKNVADANDRGLVGHQAAGFLAVYEKDIASGTLGGATAWTRVNASSVGTVSATDELELAASDYWYLSGPFRTAVRVGVDLAEITYTTGTKIGTREVYIIRSLDPLNSRQCSVNVLGGESSGSAVLPDVGESVNIRWIRTGFFAGGDTDQFGDAENRLNGFGHLVPGAITATPTSEIAQTPPFWSAGTLDTARGGTSDWNLRALEWGAYTEQGAAVTDLGRKTVKGELWGDGSIESRGGRVRGLLSSRSQSTIAIGSTQTQTFDPRVVSTIYFGFTGASSFVLTVALDGTYTPEFGDRITIYVAYNVTAGSFGELSSVVWPLDFRFSGTDATTPSSAGTVLKFEAQYILEWFLTRTDYGP